MEEDALGIVDLSLKQADAPSVPQGNEPIPKDEHREQA
jgi:hypothetical protein